MIGGAKLPNADGVEAILDTHRQIWRAKPSLRAVYRRYHRWLENVESEGRILEVGAGSGHFKRSARLPEHIVALDLQPASETDIVADAHDLPFRDGSFSAVVMIDVLHHMDSPVAFLREAARVLIPGGRMAMVEPAITPLSGPFYRAFHAEEVDMDVDPWTAGPRRPTGRPFDGNQALPTLMFAGSRAAESLASSIPELRLSERRWLALWAYPASGGFRRWCLLPRSLVAPVLWLEDLLLPWLGRLAGFRMAIELERVGGPELAPRG